MTKTLRVDLADLEGIPHASGPSGTSVVVTAEYTSPVIRASDGKIILAPKSKTMGADGRVDFDGIYASDSEEVREDHRGFAVSVTVEIREPNGGTRTWSRTVKPLEYMANVVRLGRLPSAEGLPPQWTTVEELISMIEDSELVAGPEGPPGLEGPRGPQGLKGDKGDKGDPGTTTWAGITDKPSTFPPSTHGHDMADVTGLVDEIGGSFWIDSHQTYFGPGTGLRAGAVISATYNTAISSRLYVDSLHQTLMAKPGAVAVVTGNEPRTIDSDIVFWIGGFTQPTNKAPGDVWMPADTGWVDVDWLAAAGTDSYSDIGYQRARKVGNRATFAFEVTLEDIGDAATRAAVVPSTWRPPLAGQGMVSKVFPLGSTSAAAVVEIDHAGTVTFRRDSGTGVIRCALEWLTD